MSPSGSKVSYQSYRFEISDPSQIGEARRFATQLCEQLGFDETATGRASIVLTELATNLLKHVGNGEIILQVDDSSGSECIEILGLDQGPGLADVNLCFSDGYSTSSTSGTGLGAVRRQSDHCDIYTNEKGTAILAVIQKSREQIQKGRFYLGGICLPLKSETVSGDVWSSRVLGSQKVILVADGLGHGLLAHEAANAAVEVLSEKEQEPEISRMMQEIHLRLRSTRGAAVSLNSLNLETMKLTYLSIGNVRTALVTAGETKTLISHSGTLGLQFRTAKPLDVPVPRDAKVIVHSDGLTQRWDLKAYPGLFFHHPVLIAAVLYRDFSRGTDDITVLAGGWLS